MSGLVGTSFTVSVGDLAMCQFLVHSHSNFVKTFLKISNKVQSQHLNGISFTKVHITDPLNNLGILEMSAVIRGRSVAIIWTDLLTQLPGLITKIKTVNSSKKLADTRLLYDMIYDIIYGIIYLI